MQNPNCDGAYCRKAKGEIRVLPTGGDSNALLCHACYLNEIQFRKIRNRTLPKENQFDIPFWENLEIYKTED